MKKVLIFLMVVLMLSVNLAGMSNAATISITSFSPSVGESLSELVTFSFNVSTTDSSPTARMFVDGVEFSDMIISYLGSDKYNCMYVLNTSYFDDGPHLIRYEVIADDGNDSKSVWYNFDNSPPDVRNITVHYPYGDAVPQKVDFYITAEASDLTGIDNLTINVSALQPVGNKTLIMYDDSKHNDGGAGDGVYGTEMIQSLEDDGIYYLNISATDTITNAHANHRNYSFAVCVDSSAPSISDMQAMLPTGQSSLKAGDSVRFRAYVSDEEPGYVREAWINASGLGIDGATLYDDGNHNDGTAGDGVYSTDALTVSAEGNGDVRVYFSARDWAGNMRIKFISDVSLDNERPSVDSITVSYPTNQTWAKDGDTVTVNVSASDSGGIDRVVLDASEIGGDDSIPMDYSSGNYSASVTVCSGLYRGALRVKVTAYDLAGNTVSMYENVVLNNTDEGDENENYTIIVVVNGTENSTGTGSAQNYTVVVVLNDTAVNESGNPPSIEHVSVGDGEILSGEVEITARLWNDTALQEAVLYLGSERLPMTYAGNGDYSTSIDTSGYEDGEYALSIVIRDSMDRTAQTNLNVKVDNTPPSVEVTNLPAEAVSGTLEIVAQASDISGIRDLRLVLNSENQTMLYRDGHYTLTIDTRTLPDGENTFSLIALDGAGHISITPRYSITVDNSEPIISYAGKAEINGDESVTIGISGAVMAWVRVDAGDWIYMDPASGNISISPSSMVSSDGIHYIEVRAADSAGNEAYRTIEASISGVQSSGEYQQTASEGQGGGTGAIAGILSLISLLLVVVILILVLSLRKGGRHTDTEGENRKQATEENDRGESKEEMHE